MKGKIIMVALILTVLTLLATGFYSSLSQALKPSSWTNSSLRFFSGSYNDTKTTETTSPFSSGATLSISTDNGSITITTHDKETLVLKETKKGKKEEFPFIETASTITQTNASFKTIYRKETKYTSISYELTVPASTIITQAKTSNGAISIKDVTGSVTASSSNGEIDLSRVTGEVEIHTSNGRIVLENCPRILRARSSNGMISVQAEKMGIPGKTTEIRTSNGSINFACNEFEQSNFNLNTSNGSITLVLPETPSSYTADKQLLGGHTIFTIGKAKFDVATNLGSIKIKERSR